MTQVIRQVEELKKYRLSAEPKEVGFVPTMGALHSGHLQLLKRARAENEIVVLSIYVNPTQFNDPSDFAKYPQSFEADFSIAQSAGVDCVFIPDYHSMYPDNYRFRVIEDEFSKTLCGAHRPGHFDGMLTVIIKLLNLVHPARAYFGEKDYQQLQLVRDMCDAFFLPTQIVAVATVREQDGLALSSRNIRLSPADRARASKIYQIIKGSPSRDAALQALVANNFAVEYVEDQGGRRYVAVKLGESSNFVRLIDNVEI